MVEEKWNLNEITEIYLYKQLLDYETYDLSGDYAQLVEKTNDKDCYYDFVLMFKNGEQYHSSEARKGDLQFAVDMISEVSRMDGRFPLTTQQMHHLLRNCKTYTQYSIREKIDWTPKWYDDSWYNLNMSHGRVYWDIKPYKDVYERIANEQPLFYISARFGEDHEFIDGEWQCPMKRYKREYVCTNDGVNAFLAEVNEMIEKSKKYDESLLT